MIFKQYYFATKRPYKQNTFIGGVASRFPNRTAIANLLGLAPSRVKLFEIDGKDIKFCIIGNYFVPQDTWSGAVDITHYDDRYGFCNIMGVHPFRSGSSVTSAVFPNVTFLSRQVFQGCGLLRKARFDKVNTVEVNANFSGVKNALIYLPLLQNIGPPSGVTSFFYLVTNSVVCLHENMATNNNGGPDADIGYLLSRNNTVIYVPNTTPPELINDVSFSNITNSSIDISFTEPYSLNGVSFYEIYVNDIFHSTTNTTNLTINGFFQNKNYKINVKAVDIYYNISHADNKTLYFTTTNI